MIVVEKDFYFSSAHYLPNHPGPCRALHGHNWKLTVRVACPGEELNKQGMVMDFSQLKSIVNKAIIDVVDHQYLNRDLPLENPTCENLLINFKERLQEVINWGRVSNPDLHSLTLEETNGSRATLYL